MKSSQQNKAHFTTKSRNNQKQCFPKHIASIVVVKFHTLAVVCDSPYFTRSAYLDISEYFIFYILVYFIFISLYLDILKQVT